MARYTLSPDLFEPNAYNVHNEAGEVVERIINTFVGYTYQLRQRSGEHTPHFATAQEAFEAYEERQTITNFNKQDNDNQLTLF